MKKLVILGAGHLGSLIIKAWLQKKIVKPSDLQIVVRSEASAKKLRKTFPRIAVQSLEKNAQIPVGQAYVVAVKPKQWSELKISLVEVMPPGALVVSLMAGLKPSELEAETKHPVIVAMTNTAVQVDLALTSIFASKTCKPKHKKLVTNLFSALGKVYPLDEKFFIPATAFGGSQPAFIVWILRTITQNVADQLALKPAAAQDWVLQIFLAATALVANNKDFDEILAQIATPGGCTAEGLAALSALQIDKKLNEVFERCQLKAETLGR